jgi:hypothetical protein
VIGISRDIRRKIKNERAKIKNIAQKEKLSHVIPAKAGIQVGRDRVGSLSRLLSPPGERIKVRGVKKDGFFGLAALAPE